MNKIYTDKIPETCNDCKLGYFFDTQYCFIRPDLAEKDEWCEKEKHCKLLSLSDRLKEERKRVVQEIRNHINDRIQNESCFMTRDENGELINTMATICSNYTINELSLIIKYLDQIER